MIMCQVELGLAKINFKNVVASKVHSSLTLEDVFHAPAAMLKRMLGYGKFWRYEAPSDKKKSK